MSRGSRLYLEDIVASAHFSRMRDILIHQYFGVSLNVVWMTVTEELPGLEAAVRTLLEGEP